MSEFPIPECFGRRVPEGDNRERLVCGDCGWIHYENPRVIVGAIATWEDRLLLARRAIPPREGHWTVPAGFMEQGESAEQGAAREVLEETGAHIEIDDLLGVYSIPHIAQVHLVYRARMKSANFEAGPESLEVALMPPDEIPWNDLAFHTNHWALEHFLQVRGQRPIAPFVNPTL